MFGHLKAEDFISLIELAEGNADGGVGVSQSKLRSHMLSCSRCREAFVSVRAVHDTMAKSTIDEHDIPEPDWFQFRADVRNTMLSRAAQRQAKANRWQGWFLRPAMTWGLAVAFAAGLSAGLLILNWTVAAPTIPSANVETVTGPEIKQIVSLDTSDLIADEVAADALGFDSELSARPQIRVFEELSQLNDVQSEKLQRFLEAESVRATAK